MAANNSPQPVPASAGAEDDLDELLDDALQDFQKLEDEKKNNGLPKTVNKSSDHSANAGDLPDDLADDEMMREFAKQFEQAMSGIEFPGFDPEELNKLLQANMQENDTVPENHERGNIDSSFTDAWSQFSQNLTNLPNSSGNAEEADLMEAMQKLGMGSEGDDGMMGLVQGMMQNLLSKEILHPSLSQLKEKYPSWLEQNKETSKKEEYEKYERQYTLCCQICDEFEQNTPADEEAKKKQFERIIELMFQMEKCGQPPEEIRQALGGSAPQFNQQGEQCSVM